MFRRILFLLSFYLYIQISSATADSTSACKRKIAVWTADVTLATGVHAALYQTWFSQYPSSKFHWINDNHEWLQMDKLGHAWASSTIAQRTADGFRWAGYSPRRSAVYGMASAFVFQYAIEYFDGRSAGWGASSGDLIANTAGLLYGGFQRYFWNKCRVPFRLTLHTTSYAGIRPDLLGTSFAERILKDYNGQTYWLDFNPNRMQCNPKGWPKWLGLCLGYGAEGMTGGDDNIWTDKNGQIHDRSDIQRYRQFFISPAITFGHIKSRHTWVNVLCWISDHIRVPMPAMEFNSLGKPQFHWIYW